MPYGDGGSRYRSPHLGLVAINTTGEIIKLIIVIKYIRNKKKWKSIGIDRESEAYRRSGGGDDRRDDDDDQLALRMP